MARGLQAGVVLVFATLGRSYAIESCKSTPRDLGYMSNTFHLSLRTSKNMEMGPGITPDRMSVILESIGCDYFSVKTPVFW